MKKKVNWGLITTGAVLLLVVVYLIGFAIFHTYQGSEMRKALDDIMKTKYGVAVASSEVDMTLTAIDRANVRYSYTGKYNDSNILNAFTVEMKKTEGKWAVIYGADGMEPYTGEEENEPEALY